MAQGTHKVHPETENKIGIILIVIHGWDILVAHGKFFLQMSSFRGAGLAGDSIIGTRKGARAYLF